MKMRIFTAALLLSLLVIAGCSEFENPVNSGSSNTANTSALAESEDGNILQDGVIPVDPPGDTLYIAAHAVVESPGETAWGEGMSFPGNSWAMYFIYETNSLQTVNLIAGQNTTIGNVTVQTAGNNLIITYQITASGWYFTETQLAVATSLDGIPQTGSGNPKIGKFPYKHTLSGQPLMDTYTVPLP